MRLFSDWQRRLGFRVIAKRSPGPSSAAKAISQTGLRLHESANHPATATIAAYCAPAWPHDSLPPIHRAKARCLSSPRLIVAIAPGYHDGCDRYDPFYENHCRDAACRDQELPTSPHAARVARTHSVFSVILQGLPGLIYVVSYLLLRSSG